jgi:hypothetical protein
MNRPVAAVIFCLLGAALAPSLVSAADDLLADVPAPADSKALGTESLSSGGQQASYSTSASSADVLKSYGEALGQAGWTLAGGGGGGGSYGGGGGLRATNGPKYLSLDAGGPAGTTFVHICVWPEKPADDNCGN